MNFLAEIPYRPDLRTDIKNILDAHKLVHIRQVPPGTGDEFYVELAGELGYLFRKDYDPIQKVLHHDRWTEVEFDARYIHHTYKHSNKAQPLHNDYCNAKINLDLVVLICRTASEVGGATTFLDSERLLAIMDSYRPDLLQKIRETEIIFGKTPSPIFRNSARILTYDETGRPLFSWNYAVVADDNPPEAKEVADEFHDFLETYICKAGILTEIKLEPGELVIFHDRHILHGRNAFFGPRKLLKGGIMTRNIEENLAYINRFMAI